MHLLYFTTVILFLLRLGEAALLQPENEEKPHNYDKTISPFTDVKNPFENAKIISPLAVQNVDLKDVFVFEGTYPIKYQFDIGDLYNTEKAFILQLLPNSTCENSTSLKNFCQKVRESTMEIHFERQATLENLSGLHAKSAGSGLRVTQLKNMPDEMQGNATNRFVEVLKKMEESFQQEATRRIEKSMAEIIKAEDHPRKDEINKLAFILIGSILWQQHYPVGLIKNILSKCERHHLPNHIVSQEAVRNDVRALEEKINQNGFTLAFPAAERLAAWKLPLVDCSVKDKQLHVTLNVPIRQMGNWTLQTASPISFMSSGDECRMSPENVAETTIAGVDNEYAVIHETDYNKLHKGLYVVRQTDPETEEKYSCWYKILKNSSISGSQDDCRLHCKKNDSPISIVGLGGSKYAVSGAISASIRCGFMEKSFQFPDYGSVEVDLSMCHCEMTIYSDRELRELTSPPVFCKKGKEGFPEPVHVIPSQWKFGQPVPSRKRFTSPNAPSVQHESKLKNSLTQDKAIPTDNYTKETQNEVLSIIKKKIVEIQTKKSANKVPLHIWEFALSVILLLTTLMVTVFLRWKNILAKICKRQRVVVVCKPRLVKQDPETEDV